MPEDNVTLTAILATYWPILAISFGVSLICTPLCRRFALNRNIVDHPDAHLKPHQRAIPYLGGVAIYFGWVGGVLLALFLFGAAPTDLMDTSTSPTMDRTMMIAVMIAGTLIMLLGLFDDLRLASPKTKLIGASVVVVLLMWFGLGDETILVALRSTGFRLESLPRWLVITYSVPITWIIVVGACNATNLIDGVDGLCSGVLGIISAGFLVLAVHMHLWGQWHPWDVQRVTLALAMMGASLGFLPYNRNPAKIFMGDAGSMLLGLNAAILMLLFTKSNAVKWLIGSLMVFGLPLADLVLTVARRWRAQRSLMAGDRSHFYDQLLDRGWPVRRVVALSYAMAAFFAAMGCICIALRTRYIILAYLIVVAAVIFVIAKAKMVRVDDGSPNTNTDR